MGSNKFGDGHRSKISVRALLLVVTTAALTWSPGLRASSFREIRDKVYAHPLSTPPTYKPPLLKAIAAALYNFTGELIERARTTLSDTSDYRPARPKLLHTTGVCAEGWWEINKRTFATGLLSPGADGSPSRTRAIARLSIATNNPVYKKGSKRNFTIAVKLFPSADESESVVTRNVFGFDQSGIPGDDRPSFLFANNSDPDGIYFSNNVLGKGILATIGQHTFEVLDPPSTFRALYALSEITPQGETVAEPVAPRLIQIYPRVKPKASPVPADFRNELRQYGSGELKFDLVLPEQYGISSATTIGTLTLGQPVVSSFCDLELHFHHPPENRALEK